MKKTTVMTSSGIIFNIYSIDIDVIKPSVLIDYIHCSGARDNEYMKAK